jgi:cation transport regulator ChaC
MGQRLGVFAYGSLVDPASAASTLGRPVEAIHPTWLHGWRRRFSTVRDNRRAEKRFAREADGWVPATVLLLNVEQVPDRDHHDPAWTARDCAVNGAVVDVTEGELTLLDHRELRYDRVEVTGSVPVPHDRVFAYTARREHLAVHPPGGCVVLASYARAVEAAFAGLGAHHLDSYRRGTLPYPAPVMEGRLVEGAVRAGNPHRW